MRRIDFRYALHDKRGVFVKNLRTVVSCRIDYGCFTDLLSTARIVLLEDREIDYNSDRIAPKMVLDEVEHDLGMFLISSPGREFRQNLGRGARSSPVRDLSCYSLLQLLRDDKLEDRLLIPKGTNVLAEVDRQLDAYPRVIPSGSGVTKADKEFDVGTPLLDVVNFLLQVVNFTRLRVDTVGRFVTSPYVPPQKRVPNILYDQRKWDCQVLAQESVMDSTDLFDVPNVFICYTNSADIFPPLRSLYENCNPANRLSTIYRRRVVRVEAVADIADQDTLDAYCRRIAYEASQVYSHVKFSTALNPAHGHSDCLRLVVQDLDGVYMETAWSMELSVGGRMTHEARRLVQL